MSPVAKFDSHGDGHSAYEKLPSDSDDGTRNVSRALVIGRQTSVVHRNRDDLLRAKDLVWESLANKTLPPEESELIIRRLERRADEHTRRTYTQGIPRAHVLEAAVTVSVGLTFLAGADKAQVARGEQGALVNGTPDQKSATWRVNTAASLLKRLDIAADLSLKDFDQTGEIASAAMRARMDGGGYQNNAILPSMQQLTIRDKDTESVTIDSQHVRIVNDLKNGQYDLEATLIEVDGASLLSLICNYRYLISRTGVNMTFEENRNLLNTMIEDARRLCVRSPVLFRMSTRARIINSRNTRYGIDESDQFRTISTSQGIREIISISASYFDALDPEGSNDMNQRYIKPRFLQMMVLLLLFLNNNDLKEISRVLETTYRIKADRRHIEMLLLKVVPLSSINPTLFLEALVPAVEGYNLMYPATQQRQPEFWDTFMQSISQSGYILPGVVSSLGRAQNSWIISWPQEGIKSTAIFEHLQYTGDHLRTINEITRVNLHPEESFQELHVTLLDGREYILDSQDIEPITTMSIGAFTVTDVRNNNKQLELKIQEVHVSAELEQSIIKVNGIIDEVNRQLATPRRRRLRSPRSSNLTFMNDYAACGRITKHIALLDGHPITTAYKVEGRKITKKDAWRKMARTDRQIEVVLKKLEQWAMEHYDRHQHPNLLVAVQEAQLTLSLAQDARRKVESEPNSADEPITAVMYPAAEALGLAGMWHDYHASYISRERLLEIHAKVAPVVSISWIQPTIAEVQLHGHTTKYFVKPLEEENFDAEDEVQVGDHAVLVGHYMALGKQSDEEGRNTFHMENYLRITGFEETIKGRRGANRAKAVNPMVPIYFL